MSEKCYCNDRHTIVVDRRAASRVTSCLALGAFFVFATGYFVGKRYAFQEDIDNQELSLFSHRIQYALTEQGTAQALQDPCQEDQGSDEAKQEELVQAAPAALPHIVANVVEAVVEEPGKQYVSKIAGYGTQKAAQQLVQSLEKKGIKTEIKTRVSTNAQKKSKKWYQVVTQKYASKQELETLNKLIKELAHLTEIPKVIELT